MELISNYMTDDSSRKMLNELVLGKIRKLRQ